MRTTRKVLLALVLTLCVAAVLSVCAFAALDFETDLPTGVTRDQEGWVNSGYADVDTEDGWYLMTGVDYSATETSFPTFVEMAACQFYWNKTTGEAVWVVTSNNMSSNYGEETEKSVVNASADYKKSLYAYAASFVDITGTSGNIYATTFAKDGAVDASKYVQQNASAYPIYERYIGKKIAKAIWTNVYASREGYLDFVAYKATLGYAETDKVTDEAHQDLLVEYAYNNVTNYKQVVNVKEKGGKYTLCWVLNQLSNDGYVFDSVEFRAKSGVSSIIFTTLGMTLSKLETKKVLFDAKIATLSFQDVDRGLFREASNLKTFAHVTFNTDGTYTGEVTEDLINLTGFTKVTIFNKKYNGVAADRAFGDMFSSSAKLENVLLFSSIKAGENEWAGVIDADMFYGDAGLKTVTVTAPLTMIGYRGLADCESLATIDLKGGVSSSIVIEANAFGGTTVPANITIQVYTERDKATMTAALVNAGVEGVTVVNMNPPVATEIDKAIVADGYSIRQNDENAKNKGPALRAEFTLLGSIVGNSSLELVDFGVIVFSENTFKNIYNEDIYAVYDAVLAGNDARIIRKSAKNGPYVRINEETGDITFAAAITNIPAENYTSAIYTYAYAVWSDGEELTYKYTTYTSERTGKTAHSLYDMTIFAFRNGLLNSENTDADKLFPVLEKGALAYEGNIQPSAPNKYDTTKTKFFDLPLYAHTNYSGFYSSTDTIEETSSTNILWSVFVDGNEYVVVYRKGNGTGAALLPGVSAAYTTVSHPWNSNYKAESAKTPAISGNVYKNIKTLVIDYGIEGVMINGDGALGAMAYVETIVYPNGFSNVHHHKRDWAKVDGVYKVDSNGNGNSYDGSDNNGLGYLFAGDNALKDVIWANNDGIPHMADFTLAEGEEMKHLVDLRGMGSVPTNQESFADCFAIENIVFGTKPKRVIYKNVFKSMDALERAWFETEHTLGKTYEAPAAKTIDISTPKSGTWAGFEGRLFGIKSNGYTVVLYSGTAASTTWKASFFFGSGVAGEDTAAIDALTVKLVIVDSKGNPTDPSDTFLGKIDSGVAGRVYIYRATGDNAGKYVTTTGKVFSN